MDSIFGKVLGFVCGRRTIKTGKVLWQQIKHLPTMGYGTDMLKAYENFIPHAKHYAGKTFTTQIESLNCRLRHYLARLHRKTLCYSKSKTMLEVSYESVSSLLIHLLLVFRRKIYNEFFHNVARNPRGQDQPCSLHY